MQRMLIISVILLLTPGLSWDWSTHRYVARQVCSYLDCGNCLDSMINGSLAPDQVFRDTINHHCYNPSAGCISGNWTCPQRLDCPALEKADEWLTKSREDIGCQKYYDIGVAAHYFMDSKVFWHNVQNEDTSCHTQFESQVGEQIGNDFTVSVCGIVIDSQDFDGYIKEFEGKLNAPAPSILDRISAFINSIIDLLNSLMKFQKAI